MALAALFSVAPQQKSADDYNIISNKVENGIRTIVATPSSMVCSKKMEIQIDTKTTKIVGCQVTGGCNGNLKALCTLMKGMTVKEVVGKLYGNKCGKMDTSCMDQLCRILKACYPDI